MTTSYLSKGALSAGVGLTIYAGMDHFLTRGIDLDDDTCLF